MTPIEVVEKAVELTKSANTTGVLLDPNRIAEFLFYAERWTPPMSMTATQAAQFSEDKGK